MFKRVIKKQKKRDLEEELGLDDEAKQMFGMHDTDTDESSSDTSDAESASSDGGSSDDDFHRASAAEVKTEWLAAEGSGSGDDSDEEGLDLSDEREDIPRMSLKEAMKNPIYLRSADKDSQACIVCPKKLLKNTKMLELHVVSVAHIRRFKKFCALAETRKYHNKDPMRVTAAISQDPKAVSNAEGLSKRGLKRKQKLEGLKEKREKTKQIIERKKRKRPKKETRKETSDDAGKGSESGYDQSTSERLQKRRKMSTEKAAQEKGGGDYVESGDQATPAESRKTKAKAKAKTKAGKAGKDVNGDNVSAARLEPEPKGKTEALLANTTSKNIATIKRDAASPTKQRDIGRIKTKGHMGRAGAGRFAKLSDTQPVKDKSKRKARPEGKSAVRMFPTSKKLSRYFDAPEGGTVSKEVGPIEAHAKRPKRAGKGDDGKQVGKTGPRRKPNATDDLVIFG